MSLPEYHSFTYNFTADQTDAQGRMPMWLIANRIIEMATAHANRLGIGYADLVPHGIGWVLSRMSIEVVEYPPVNSDYTFLTWIESLNRHFSERCMVVTDTDGEELIHVRTTWICIDIANRTLAPLDALSPERFPMSGRDCPVAAMRKVRPLPESAEETTYTFTFDDIDINRHVNTIQWVRLILNAFPMDWHNTHEISRFDIAFQHECYYGETVSVRTVTTDLLSQCEILAPGGTRAVTASISWRAVG